MLVVAGDGRPLVGSIEVGGAKNAALPLMIAGILTDGALTLAGMPDIKDVHVLGDILASIGADVAFDPAAPAAVTISGRALADTVVENPLFAEIRASFLLSGALLARRDAAVLPRPGGDAIGARPVDLHLDGFERLGAVVRQDPAGFTLQVPRGRLTGAVIPLAFPSVGATENLMMAAVLAHGRTTISNAAREPEIVDLAACLRAMGAEVAGAGTDTITIDGVERLTGAVHRVMPDRIELGTYVCAAGLTHGRLCFPGASRAIMGGFADWAEAAGIELAQDGDALVAAAGPHGLRPPDVTTAPYPGFATDMQPQAMVVAALGRGTTRITEALFEHRFQHVPELRRMGARIDCAGRTATISGVPHLAGARVAATDVRAGAALVIAALAAEGTTEISGVHHIARGYERIIEKLAACGAAIDLGRDA